MCEPLILLTFLKSTFIAIFRLKKTFHKTDVDVEVFVL